MLPSSSTTATATPSPRPSPKSWAAHWRRMAKRARNASTSPRRSSARRLRENRQSSRRRRENPAHARRRAAARFQTAAEEARRDAGAIRAAENRARRPAPISKKACVRNATACRSCAVAARRSGASLTFSNSGTHGDTALRARDPARQGLCFLPQTSDAPGSAAGVIAGSSNLTRAGVTKNLELNLGRYDDPVASQAQAWFNDLWDEAVPFDLADLLAEVFARMDPVRDFLCGSCFGSTAARSQEDEQEPIRACR